ncbi:MAG: hypothetical protein OJF55_002600 [Rhodanobacteraceae bacterium]|nr:MAG: hypothetical protein OJF55_002600 [Rhodanobacteraceae bacterium]
MFLRSSVIVDLFLRSSLIAALLERTMRHEAFGQLPPERTSMS